MVSQSFIENKYETEDNIDVDHMDKNPKNNHVSNLQWLDRKAHVKKDQGIAITEVCDDGIIKKYDTMADAGRAIGKDSSSISYAIKNGKSYMKSKWYKTSEYKE